MSTPTTAAGLTCPYCGIEAYSSEMLNAHVRIGCRKAEARQQDGSALRVLLDAIETMDQKITPYGEREDGTILHYIVADSTWHRILAAARSAEIFAALPPSAPPAVDVERLRQAWWNLCVAPPRDDAHRWEPDRYNAGLFLQAVMAEYARLQEQDR